MSSIVFLGDECDHNLLIEKLLDLKLFMYSDKNERIYNPFQSCLREIRCFPEDCCQDTNYILMQISMIHVNLAGKIQLIGENEELKGAFHQIKRYVTKKFIHGVTNIGPHLYSEWNQHKIKLDKILLQERVNKKRTTFEEKEKLFLGLQQNGVIIEKAETANMLKCEGYERYYLYYNNAHLKYYECSYTNERIGTEFYRVMSKESEAIFVTEERRKKEVCLTFEIDERCFDVVNGNQSLVNLYQIIEQWPN